MSRIQSPSTELWHISTVYIMRHCDLDLRVVSRDATWVVNPCTKFEQDMTYHYIVRTTTIFHLPPFKVQFFYVFWG